MNKAQLFNQIKEKKSFLCVGLDSDLKKIPQHLLDFEDPIFEFNKQIIDSTKDVTVAYKPNIAFYEAMGSKGWDSLEKTINYIPKEIFTIADAKRGDIGNTSSLYARAFFENLNFDSVTVAPYMGSDSVKPFLEFENKWVILLGVTSNEGGKDFQFLESNGKPLYQHVLGKSSEWGNTDNMMYVVGATRPEYLEDIRKTIPDHFLLVPGVGAQGGDLEEVCKYGLNSTCGLLINSARGIIYASNKEDFAEKAGEEAIKLQQQMAPFVESLI
ncbi:orotidine-5'-phosphate decarboxylase [Reichenbachiella versicolor]|uniref:orotidine-5'-phosphate decarboxylase n=1 Tax=Reichenbachiella versicolor TaxID=1821036 RepID=UPI000D6E635D|nr:orotidine-5'-phosphate decarboxylase [Reichenbachiella versicolor]